VARKAAPPALKITSAVGVYPLAFRTTTPHDWECQSGRKKEMEYILLALMADGSVHLVPPMSGFSTCRQGHQQCKAEGRRLKAKKGKLSTSNNSKARSLNAENTLAFGLSVKHA
jgi:hypothetical protein